MYVSNNNGTYCYKSTDYGANWSAITNLGSQDAWAVNCSSDGSKVMVGKDANNNKYSTNGGTSWVDLSIGDHGSGISGDASFTRIYSNNQLVRKPQYSVNGGASWSQSTLSNTDGIETIDCDSTGQIVAFATYWGAGVFISTDYGVNYTHVAALPNDNRWDLEVSYDGNAMITAGGESWLGYVYSTGQNAGCSMSINAVNGLKKCAGETFSLAYEIGTAFNSGNVFTVQLSNSSGNFTSTTNIGTVSSTSSGTVTCTIPSTTTPGSSYRIRIISSSPSIVDTVNAINIIIGTRPTPAITGTSDCCSGSTLTYATTNNAGSTYSWAVGPEGAVQSGANTNQISVKWVNTTSAAKVDTVRVTETVTTTGCVKDTFYLVTVNPNPVVNCGIDREVCFGSSVTIAATATGGTGTRTYSWSPTTGLNSATVLQPSASPTSTTQYILTVSDSKGCTSRDTVLVTVLPSVNVNAGADKEICAGQSVMLTTSSSGGSGVITYQWTPSAGLNDATLQSPTASPVNTTSYIVLATDAKGCIKRDTLVVTVNQLATVDASIDKDICSGSSVTLNATATGGTGALSYSWTPTTGLSSPAVLQPVANPSATTQYILTVNDSKGCSSKDTVVVVVNPRPSINAGSDKSICPGTVVQIGGTATNGTGAIGYSWSPTSGIVSGTATSAVIGVSPGTTTNYIVTVTDSKGCDQTDTVKVTVYPKPAINAGANQTTCPGVGVTIGNVATGSSGYQYSWSPSGGLSATNVAQPTAAPATTTTYKVVVTDANGCSDSSSVEVRVRQQAATTNKANLDFGILGACDGSKELTMDITNTGSDDIIINRQQMPSGFVLVTALPISISKGSTQTVTLRYAPTAQGVSQGNAVLTSDPCDYSITVQVRGEKLQLAYKTDKPSVGFGISLACIANVQWDSVITIQNTGTDKMTIQGASVGGVFSIVSPTNFPIDINPGGTLAVTVRYKPTSQGTFSDQIKLPFKAGSCTNEINVPVSASHILPDAGVTPPAVNFPAMLGCDIKRDTVITISNTNGVDVTLESITGDAQFKVLTALPLVIPVGEKRQIQLRFEPSGSGNASTSLTITANPCNRQRQFSVSGNKQGVTFAINDTLDLGAILPCSQNSISKQLVIKNTSDGGVSGSVSNVSTTAGFSSTIKSGDILPNNQDVNYTVTFTPNATTPLGVSIGKLDLGFLPCDIAKTVYVRAAVLALGLAADPTVDFGSVSTGTNRTKTVSVVNTGTADMQISTISGLSSPFSLGTVTPPLPTTLKPGDTMHVDVVFASQAGTFNQILSIGGNQPCAISTKTVLNAEGTDKPIPVITGFGKNVGDVSIGQNHLDSVTVTNDGTVAMRILSASFDASSNKAFSIPTTQFPIPINVGEKKQITFSFLPSVVGLTRGYMIITGEQDTASAEVTGRGIDTVQSTPSLTTVASIQYDSVCIGQSKRMTVGVKNNGKVDVQLQSANWNFTANNPFTLIGFTPQVIKVDSTITVSIDFAPTFAGAAGNIIQWVGDKASTMTTVAGMGKMCAGLPDTVRTTVELSTIEAKAGEHVVVNLVMSNKQKMNLPNAPTKYEANIKLNSTVLTLEEPGVNCSSLDGTNCEIVLKGVYTKNGSDTLQRVRALATLGNTDYAEIELTKFVWQDTVLTTEVLTKSGSVRILSVCDDGSVRLVIPTGSKQSLASRPNPAKDEIRVEYGLKEPMIVSLEIVNLSGQVVARPVVSQQSSIGLHILTVDVSNLSAGVYHLRLLTPGSILSTRVDIIH